MSLWIILNSFMINGFDCVCRLVIDVVPMTHLDSILLQVELFIDIFRISLIFTLFYLTVLLAPDVTVSSLSLPFLE